MKTKTISSEAAMSAFAATLKGKALVMAIDAGLIPESPNHDSDWNIAPFLNLWEQLTPMLVRAIKEAAK